MEEYQENTENKNTLTDENHISWRDVLGGRAMLKPQVTKHYRLLLLVFILSMLYIGNKLECEQQERSIERLKAELPYKEMEYHKAMKTLNEEESLEKVTEKLKKYNFELKVSGTPPFIY